MTTTTEMPAASVQVMRAGHALSPDVLQFLASEIATAASRERDRRVTVIAVSGLLGLGVLRELVFGNEELALYAAAAVCAGALIVRLAWGVRNRALLDRSAHDAAIAPRVLGHAVRLVW